MTTAIAKTTKKPASLDLLTKEQSDLVKRTIANGATDDEFALFMAQVNRTRLDPFSRQIWFSKREDYAGGGEAKVVIGVTIDGLRLQAQRSGEMDGQEGPLWCGPDGIWKDVWLAPEPPAAAMVKVHRKGCSLPFVGIALWSAYAQKSYGMACPECGKTGTILKSKNAGESWFCWAKRGGCGATFKQAPGKMVEVYQARWAIDGANMLAKCAEALANRKAFPAETSGLYTDDELPAIDAVVVEKERTVIAPPASEPKKLPPAAPEPPPAAEPKPEPKKPDPTKKKLEPTPPVPATETPKPEPPKQEAPKPEPPSPPPPVKDEDLVLTPVERNPNDTSDPMPAFKVKQVCDTFAKLGVTPENLEWAIGLLRTGWTANTKNALLKLFAQVNSKKEDLAALKECGPKK